MKTQALFLLVVTALALPALQSCSQAYYGAWEKIGVHKRDIMVERVEKARDSQTEAQKQFQSALDQFASVVAMKESDLKTAYEKLNSEYQASQAAADNVRNRIRKVEKVSEALFAEWADELKEYRNQSLRTASERKLKETRQRYQQMAAAMHQAENSMNPVLLILKDNVLFLKHNLNAQAIGSLQGEVGNLQGEIANLIEKMNAAIDQSNRFISDLQR